MAGVLKVRTSTGPDVWTPSGVGVDVNKAYVDGKIQARVHTPASDTNFDGTGSFALLFQFSPNVTVPAGATTAFVQVTLSRVFLAGTIIASEWELRAGIGGQFSGGTRLAMQAAETITAAKPTVTHAGLITLSGSGSQAFVMQSQRVAGTGVARIDTVSDAVGLVIFL